MPRCMSCKPIKYTHAQAHLHYANMLHVILTHVHFIIRSLDRHDLFVPRARTSMAQTRALAIIGPLLWNQLLSSTRSTLLTGEPSASFRFLKTALFFLGFSHWKRF